MAGDGNVIEVSLSRAWEWSECVMRVKCRNLVTKDHVQLRTGVLERAVCVTGVCLGGIGLEQRVAISPT